MTLGWIHTHPEFDVFLSSVDLHNQMGYQLQLPEAIAIVYSPIAAKPGFYSLRVKDSQMENIKNCKMTGFHEHLDNQGGFCWEKCKHVTYLAQGSVPIKVLDLR